jgi:hypothetical protein
MDEQLLLGNLDNDQNTLPESTQKMTLELVQNRGGSTSEHVWLDTLFSIIILE